MDNNFETLKSEVKEIIKNLIGSNDKELLNYINTILIKLGSELTVRKNMSIASFEKLLINSKTVEEFKIYLSKLDVNKDYEVYDLVTLNEDIAFNEKCKDDNIEEYFEYKKFLESRIKLNDDLFIIEYPKNN